MSYLNKIFSSVPVNIPDRSGFDLSHEVISTANCGTVIPITHFEVLPADTISMGSLMKVTLPPFAVPFMGRIDAELTAAFIPNRLLWKGWQSFITQNSGSSPSGSGSRPVPISVPLIDESPVRRGSLKDYLGVSSSRVRHSALPFLAYHKFCDDWIRDDNLSKPFFAKDAFTVSSQGASIADSENLVHVIDSFYNYTEFGSSVPVFSLDARPNEGFALDNNIADFALGDLRQRCWAKDYFTTATTRPQAGAASSVVFDTSGNTGQFTIASLRAANSLQKWMERNNIAGTDYGDQILSHFGVRPPDAVLNRSVLLGQVRTPVYVGSVTNNSSSGNSSNVGTSSPFGSILGSAAGFGSASDKGSLIDNFTAKEHGFIMVFFTLIPHAYYDSGVTRSNLHKSIGDFAFPEFAGIGDQPIYLDELFSSNDDPSLIFGYNQRFSEYKFLPDRISGLVSTGQSLEVYALKRSFGLLPELGSQFSEIPVDFLSQVFSAWNTEDGEGSESPTKAGFSCMIDVYFDCKALRVLPEYSLPHL